MKAKTLRCVAVVVGVLVFFGVSFCMGNQGSDREILIVRSLVQSNNYNELRAYVKGLSSSSNSYFEHGRLSASLAISKLVIGSCVPSKDRNYFLLEMAENVVSNDVGVLNCGSCDLLSVQESFLSILMSDAVFACPLSQKEKRCLLVARIFASVNDALNPALAPVKVTVSDCPPVAEPGDDVRDIPVGFSLGMRPEVIKNERLRKQYEAFHRGLKEWEEYKGAKCKAEGIYATYERQARQMYRSFSEDDPAKSDLVKHWLVIGRFPKSFVDSVLGAFPP